MSHSRRDFLVRTSCAALSAAAAQSSIRKLGLMSALAQPTSASDYRALVCIFLDGGNDSNNMIIPTDTANYNQYLAARSLSSGLGLDAATLLSLGTPPAFNGTGRTFGLHPSLPDLASLYGQGKLAVVTQRRPARRAPDAGRLHQRSQADALLALLALGPDRVLADLAGHAAHRDGLGRPHRRRHSRLQQCLGLPDRHVDLRGDDVLRGRRDERRSRSTRERSIPSSS